MTLKTLSGASIPAALADARRIFGSGVVLLASSPASGGSPASVTVAVDGPAPATPAPEAAPRRSVSRPAPEALSTPRRYGYAATARQSVPDEAARDAAPRHAPAPVTPMPSPVPPSAPLASSDRTPEEREQHVDRILAWLEASAAVNTESAPEPVAAPPPPSPPPSPPASAAPRPFRAPEAAPARADGAPRKLILVGPAGAGKTSLAMRIGLRPELLGGMQAGALVIAPEEGPFLDPTPVFWASGVPAALVHTAADLASGCAILDAADLLLVDTPPLPLDPARATAFLQRLGTLLAPLAPVEVVFVADATRSAASLAPEAVRGLGLRPDALALTRADEASPGAVDAWTDRLAWPLRIVSAGPALSDLVGPVAPLASPPRAAAPIPEAIPAPSTPATWTTASNLAPAFS